MDLDKLTLLEIAIDRVRDDVIAHNQAFSTAIGWLMARVDAPAAMEYLAQQAMQIDPDSGANLSNHDAALVETLDALRLDVHFFHELRSSERGSK